MNENVANNRWMHVPDRTKSKTDWKNIKQAAVVINKLMYSLLSFRGIIIRLLLKLTYATFTHIE